MTRRRGVSARTAALVKAAEAIARRDTERVAREVAVQAALAEFFQAQGGVERIYAEAEKAVAPFDAAMQDAVRALRRLGEARGAIVELTGLPASRVRLCLDDEGAAPSSGDANVAPSSTAPPFA